MEWIDTLRGAVVGLDTALLIYLIEENSNYLPFVRPFFEAVDRVEFRIVTSSLTLAEVLVHPCAAVIMNWPGNIAEFFFMQTR